MRGAGARYLTIAGFAEGVRLSVPAIPVMALFGTAFGAFAAQKGLALLEATVMSALMFAGASQFVATEMWTEPLTASMIFTLCLVTAAVNMRFMLMTASMRPWLGGLPAWQTYPAMALLTEPGWLIAMRYRAAGGTDHSIVLSSGIALWLVWIASTMLGYLLGAGLIDIVDASRRRLRARTFGAEPRKLRAGGERRADLPVSQRHGKVHLGVLCYESLMPYCAGCVTVL